MSHTSLVFLCSAFVFIAVIRPAMKFYKKI